MFLKTIITSKPSTSITKRDPEDECLIIATDGIWDAISNDLACQVAITCLKEGSPATALRSPSSSHVMSGDDTKILFPSKSAFAATILCRLALGRGSTKNISFIVVDLMGHWGKILMKGVSSFYVELCYGLMLHDSCIFMNVKYGKNNCIV